MNELEVSEEVLAALSSTDQLVPVKMPNPENLQFLEKCVKNNLDWIKTAKELGWTTNKLQRKLRDPQISNFLHKKITHLEEALHVTSDSVLSETQYILKKGKEFAEQDRDVRGLNMMTNALKVQLDVLKIKTGTQQVKNIKINFNVRQNDTEDIPTVIDVSPEED